MAKQTFTSGQVLTASQMNTLQTNDFNMTVSTKTADYTLAVDDRGTRVAANGTATITFTVPNNVFTAGDTVAFHNINSGNLTVAAGTGVTLNALSTSIVQWQGATLYATSTSSFILFPTGGAMKTTKVDAFTANGTFTPPAGVTYAIAHIRAGGGGVGTASAGTGGTSSVEFAGGTISASGGIGHTVNIAVVSARAGAANSGQGAVQASFATSIAGEYREDKSPGSIEGGTGAYIVAGGTVTPGVGITVTVGAGGTAGTNGAAGGSGYVWIEYAV